MKEDTKKALAVVGIALTVGGTIALAKKAEAEPDEKCEPGCPPDCWGYDRYDCVANGGWELTEADSPDCGYTPELDTGRFQGFVMDELSDEGIADATLYINNKLELRTDKDGAFLTGSMEFRLYEIKILAGGYEETTFNVNLDQRLKEVVFAIPRLEETPGWPDDIQVTGIIVKPTIILGQDVDIGVRLLGPALPVYPRVVTGSITVDDTTLTGSIEMRFRNPTMLFEYTPTATGIFTIRAKNESAHFQVLPGQVGIFHSPFGCIRTELHPMHIEVPAADPPYWTTIADLVQHMVWTTGARAPGPGIVDCKDRLVRGSFTALSGNQTGYRCPHCDIWIKAGRHDHIGVMSKLLDHIETAHPEFPLDKPPAGIVYCYRPAWRERYQCLGSLVIPGQYSTDLGTVTLPDYGSVARLYPDERRVVTETWEERLL